MNTRKRLLRAVYQTLRGHRKKCRRLKPPKICTACLAGTVFLCAFLVSGASDRLISMEHIILSESTQGLGEVQAAQETENVDLQAGLMGVVKGAISMQAYAQAAQAANTSSASENILVGAARTSRTERRRSSVETAARSAGELFAEAKEVIRANQMSEDEYYTLLRIVEAEATGEDQDGKCLIANVILNRVRDSRFPDTIQEVVFQQVDGSAQFQPTVDGRMYSVEITEDTILAVDRALAGEDNSQGALYFMARDASEDASIGWFEENLVWLFQHGGHEYYTLE